ncbi:MAG: Si-specific NAD(P)(+) transhydrogenase [SAR202 cluster bacterium]|nr:Si-specific NAD(P)(+) transhydrogenase [SAR202 cluster bacterium]
MSPAHYDYDMLVIGSGPAGQRAAIQAAKIGKRVVVVERKAVVGGVCVNTGTIPSKALRESVMYLSGYRLRSIYGASYAVKQDITMQDLMFRAQHVIRNEIDVFRAQMSRNGVAVINAYASFVDPHTVHLDYVEGSNQRNVTAANVVIATGSGSQIDADVPDNHHRTYFPENVLEMDKLPRTMAVVGAGVIGAEYASIFAALGIRITLIDKRDRILPFADEEIVESLMYHLRQNRVTMRLGEQVASVKNVSNGRGESVQIMTTSGKEINADAVLYCAGRSGQTLGLNLQSAGVASDHKGRIKVNEHYQTEAGHIYAVGDVIGFPSLASTSMEQGRLAACHAFGVPAKSVPALFPYGIYAIPEISMVGRNEQELTDEGVPYEIGKAFYREIARGHIIGDTTGLLKLIFHLETRELLGVHIIGEGASDLVHIGQAVLSFGGTVDYFVETVFNYPTLAECYKTAALDGINRLGR